jgi:hypothetical protein
MILEEIDGDVKVSLNGKALAIGDTIEDSQYPLVSVTGKGKATFRVDPSCTVECKGVEITLEAGSPAPVVEKVVVKTVTKTVAAPAPEPAPEPAPAAPAAE